jgi:hypothetical protein
LRQRETKRDNGSADSATQRETKDMAARETIIYVCDLCGKESPDTSEVETRQIIVGGRGAEAEVCVPCWTGVVGAFAEFAKSARLLPLRTPGIRAAKSIPGSAWRFTSHALIRCGERNLDPLEIVAAIDDPTIVRPGRASDQEIRERGSIKAVVVPDRGVVVTVARKGEADDALSDAS